MQPDAPSDTIIQALVDPAMTLDQDLNVLDANVAARDVFGWVRLRQHISLTSRHPELMVAVVDAHRLRQRRTFVLDMRTPLDRRLEGIVTPLTVGAQANDPAAFLILLRDLTEQERLAAMRADFVANASHELRTPLASLKGFIETMQGPARNDVIAQGRFLEIMSQQADRMTRLIDDLLSLSRIEMRAHIPPSATVDLNDVASSVVAALEPLIKRAGVTVAVHKISARATVRGEQDELVQAVQNLVQNAIKYGKSDGRIDVQIGDESSGWRSISISDDGPGIAPEHLPRLTERFYRVSVASSRDRGGTGLGLAIVKHIVTRHRGALAITSNVGHGATFKITLPAV
jgi:two-component system, OmpR family, phosphate regulon sensor histidine kinase PhoR